MITGKKIASSVSIALLIFITSVCYVSEREGTAINDFLVQNWMMHPYSMLKLAAISLFDGIVLTALACILYLFFVKIPRTKRIQVQIAARQEASDEDILAKETSPFQKGYVPANSFYASHLIFGKSDGIPVSTPVKRNFFNYLFNEAQGNIMVFGKEGMRKYSGIFIPSTQRAIDRHNNIIIFDTKKGDIFNAVYAQLKLNGYRVLVLDMKDPERSMGFNALASASDARNIHLLTMLLVNSAGLPKKMEKSVTSILETCFIRIKQIYKDATLGDALEYLQSNESNDLVDFNWEYVYYWSRPNTSDKEHLRANWQECKDMAVKILTPYASEPMLNKGLVPDDFFDGATVPDGDPCVLIVRSTDIPSISPINDYIFSILGDEAISCLDKVRQKRHSRVLSVISCDPSHASHPKLREFTGTSRWYNIDYMINAISIKNIDTGRAAFSSESNLEYIDYLMLTGTPDNETAAYLESAASYCFNVRKDALERVEDFIFAEKRPKYANAIPFTNKEELLSITREEVYVVGSPECPAAPKTAYASTPDALTNGPGLFKLTKLYYKEHPKANASILDLNTGKTKRLTIETYDHTLEDRYEGVIGSDEHRPI